MPACDLVIVALKTTANGLLPDLLPGVVKQDGLVLTLQNGLGSEETIAASADPERILSGLCFLCSNKVGPGLIRHLDYGLITLGDYRADGQPAGVTPRLEQLGAALSSAGISVRTVEDLPLARWKKLVWNIPFNGLTVVHDALTDQLLKDPAIRVRARTLMQEVAAASEACARPIEEAFIDKMMADTEKMTPYAPSMKLDYDRGRPMEIESIYGEPLRRAAGAGIDMPETRALYERLRELDAGS
jgi:2-dehydropantoate 2-reductase